MMWLEFVAKVNAELAKHGLTDADLGDYIDTGYIGDDAKDLGVHIDEFRKGHYVIHLDMYS
jgi:hypothetical protein